MEENEKHLKEIASLKQAAARSRKWADKNEATKIGYELSFTKYFYKPVQLRPMEDIVADLKALEQETDGMLADILGGIQG